MNRIEKEAAAYFELQSFSIYNLKFRLYNKPVEKETDIMINKWQITIPSCPVKRSAMCFLIQMQPMENAGE